MRLNGRRFFAVVLLSGWGVMAGAVSTGLGASESGGTAAKVAEIGREVRGIEGEAGKYRKVEVSDLMYVQEMSNTVTGYYLGKELRKVVLHLDRGEWDVYSEWYFVGGMVVFVVGSEYHWYFVEGEEKSHRDLTERNRYYFDGGKVIRTTSEKPHMVPYDDGKFHPMTRDELGAMEKAIKRAMSETKGG